MFDKLVSILGGNLFTGVTDLVKAFKLPPEQQIQFEQKMAEMESNLQITLEKIAAEDRNSARQREMALAAAGKSDSTNKYLSYLIVGVFGAAQYMVFTHTFPPDQAVMVARVLGTIDMALGLVLGYYFGSSASSRKKDEALHDLVKGNGK